MNVSVSKAGEFAGHTIQKALDPRRPFRRQSLYVKKLFQHLTSCGDVFDQDAGDLSLRAVEQRHKKIVHSAVEPRPCHGETANSCRMPINPLDHRCGPVERFLDPRGILFSYALGRDKEVSHV